MRYQYIITRRCAKGMLAIRIIPCSLESMYFCDDNLLVDLYVCVLCARESDISLTTYSPTPSPQIPQQINPPQAAG